ncbi:MAG: ClbS/DfsB family four-helix bundle protein [Anaerolineae bacterium]|nr:MAG: ClbS/DfsB family four-helix bundle protein [Anaerolineae bacterium]
MNKATLLAELENSREALLDALEALPEEALLRPGTVGDWSIKDTLAHLTMWEAQLITLLWQARQGRKPSTVHFQKRNTDDINAEWHRQNQNRPLALVWSDFVNIREQTIRRVQAIPEGDLLDPRRYSWLRGRPLWKWIAAHTFEHERKHLAHLL